MHFYEFLLELLHGAVNFIDGLSYLEFGLIVALETTCFPIMIPIETIIIPMGYLAYLGKKHIATLLITSIVAILAGCLVNYYTAYFLGRPIIYRYSKYFMINVKTLEKWEKAFLKNSRFIMFIGRCIPIPAVKHIITIPAGLSKMNIIDFVIYNFLGGLLFSSAMLSVGYFFGNNIALIKRYIYNITAVAVTIAAAIIVYLCIKSYYSKKKKS